MAFEKTFVFIVVLSIIVGTLAQPQAAPSGVSPDPTALQKFEQWVSKFGRIYQDIAEKEMRLAIFLKNLFFVENFNTRGNKTYQLNLNEFSDMTNHEFLSRYTGFVAPNVGRSNSSSLLGINDAKSFRYQNLSDNDIPASIDWRQQGAVTPVKNQGQCGSCWAFSAVATVEGISQIKTGRLISLSEQQLVDCSTDDVNHGCNKGNEVRAYEYIKKNGGITSEENYQYNITDDEEVCDSSKTKQIYASITGYEMVPTNSEKDLLKAVAKQPVSVAIDTNGEAFKAYAGGVLTGSENACGSTDLNHAVTIVGYGTTKEGIDYWLVKNSWGESWGENGYMRILRNAGPPEGLCGIAMYAAYPTA